LSQRRGILAAAMAYFLWGILPLYWKFLQHVHAYEIILHRIIWSAVSLVLLVLIIGKKKLLLESLKDKKSIRIYFISSCFIAFNWFLYIYAVLGGRTIEASLGYYICPLVVVTLGTVFFKDKISLSSKIALAFALFAVLLQVYQLRKLPLIAITLAMSFALYAFIRKRGKLDPIMGLTLETVLLLPIALIALLYLSSTEGISLFTINPTTDILLLLSGIVTSTPLLFYGEAIRTAKLSTVGFMQYLGPTISLLIGWAVFKEELSWSNGITFVIVGFGLLFFVFQPFDRKKLLND
jgi:chloramphenicol-sensitive protein RarD